jgi:hypothetical protein
VEKTTQEELYDQYSSAYIIRVTESRRMRWKGHVAHKWVRIGTYRVLMGRSELNRPLGRASLFPVFRQK